MKRTISSMAVRSASLDLILNGVGTGRVAQKLLSLNGDVSAMRPWIGEDNRCYITVNEGGVPVAKLVANATLRKDEWKQYDMAVVKAAQQRLVGVADLRSRGLEYSTNGLSKTVLEYEDASDMEAAQLSMDGATRGKTDRLEYVMKYLPLPILHKDFQINARALAASRNGGSALDTTLAEMAGMKVAELAESILFTGYSSFAFGGGTIYGYMDFPYRNSVTLTLDWDDSTKTGANILKDVQDMKQASIDDRHYGPWILYVPTAYETVLSNDYVSGYPKSIRQRLLEIEGIEDIKVADKLTANNVILAEMQATTVREVVGMDITTVEWEVEGGMILNYKVMAIMVPQLRADQANRCGIIHLA